MFLQMKYTRETIYTDNIVHIYNRGVDKRIIFLDNQDYTRFLYTCAIARSLNYPISTLHDCYRRARNKGDAFLPLLETLIKNHSYQSPLCEVIAYTLMPNHFHFVIKQTELNGIEKFMQKLSNSYTKYFNGRYERSGTLFEASYKYIFVESEYQLIHLLRYVYLNPLDLNPHSPQIIKKWQWTSFNSYFEAYSKIPLIEKSETKELYQEVLKGIEEGKAYTQLGRLKQTLNVL